MIRSQYSPEGSGHIRDTIRGRALICRQYERASAFSRSGGSNLHSRRHWECLLGSVASWAEPHTDIVAKLHSENWALSDFSQHQSDCRPEQTSRKLPGNVFYDDIWVMWHSRVAVVNSFAHSINTHGCPMENRVASRPLEAFNPSPANHRVFSFPETRKPTGHHLAITSLRSLASWFRFGNTELTSVELNHLLSSRNR
jgi:hypothetical protein